MLLFHLNHPWACSQCDQHVQKHSACGIQQQGVDHEIAFGKQRRCAQEERRRRNVAGYGSFNCLQPLAAGNAHAVFAPIYLRSKSAQSYFAMIARPHRFLNAGFAISKESGEQKRSLDLSARDRRLVVNRAQLTPLDDEGSAPFL